MATILRVAQVPRLLESTQRAIDEGQLHLVELCARFHAYFEYLHPFRDGNGRTGRLLVNKILLSKGHPIIVIPKDARAEYINCLRLFRTDSPEHLIDFFFKTAVKRMRHEMDEKKRMTSEFTGEFEF